MALTDRLRDLDQKLLPGTREPDEDAETYLRRVAAGRAITPAQAGDVMAALRVYFGVDAAAADDKEDQNDEDQYDDDQNDDDQNDQAAESGGDEKDEASEQSEDGSEQSEEESEQKSDDES